MLTAAGNRRHHAAPGSRTGLVTRLQEVAHEMHEAVPRVPGSGDGSGPRLPRAMQAARTRRATLPWTHTGSLALWGCAPSASGLCCSAFGLCLISTSSAVPSHYPFLGPWAELQGPHTEPAPTFTAGSPAWRAVTFPFLPHHCAGPASVLWR